MNAGQVTAAIQHPKYHNLLAFDPIEHRRHSTNGQGPQAGSQIIPKRAALWKVRQ